MIRKVAVLGAGTMGSRIAAHFANVGIPVLLLDISRELARKSTAGLVQSKPPAFFESSSAELITPGSFDEDIEPIADCDWIVEAVSEQLDIKRDLLKRVAPLRKADAIVTTNTSGLPVSQIASGLDADFQRHWFGVHFFNPPRYMRLVEMIPTPVTDISAFSKARSFLEETFGKTIVVAKDRPSFIANRIGIFALLNNVRLARELCLSVETVDALTGPLIGWPKTGTFGLIDLIGLDVLWAISENFCARVHDERKDVGFPAFMARMVERGALGSKSGRGFYQKGPVASVLDLQTCDYRPVQEPGLPILQRARKVRSLPERLNTLLNDREAARFLWPMLSQLWNYTAHRIPEIADDIVSIDTAMKAGFNWEYGPFELWDALGVATTAARMQAEGLKRAPATAALLKGGNTSWYRERTFFDVSTNDYRPLQQTPSISSMSRGTFASNASVSLIDIGDSIACLEIHTKMNVLGGDVLSFIQEHLARGTKALDEFRAFVIYTDQPNFSAGANLSEVLQLIEAHDWTGLETFISNFQRMTQAVKFCPRPIVAGPVGLCLGGGAELAMHCSARVAHAELSMGLVEILVGLLPGGGGCKELALLATDGEIAWLDALTTLTTGIRSSSAAQARSMHLLRRTDEISMSRERLILAAKDRALACTESGPERRGNILAAATDVRELLDRTIEEREASGALGPHDVTVARAVKRVLCAEHVLPGTMIAEDDFLALEREMFVALCREPKTKERIAHMLTTGKPLRN